MSNIKSPDNTDNTATNHMDIINKTVKRNATLSIGSMTSGW